MQKKIDKIIIRVNSNFLSKINRSNGQKIRQKYDVTNN